MTKYLCRIISRFTLIINDKVLMYLWKTVMHKKVSHPNEIQNTFVSYYERKYHMNSWIAWMRLLERKLISMYGTNRPHRDI